ncbi:MULTISPECIES: hypothetical protein [Clostridium]|uniref:Protein distantly similar to N-terminal of HSP60 chaperonin family n=3 Tax=Clostridium acetobutylicum TaxID=1488 RepID=Q97DV3_CLOAB|nr:MULTISPECIES: hypothetical protein [Clostridium]AAK81299.1 Protein distantly similar to N-terminal fragment of HSP60 chaperonin family [Clostridium acetobutylicum ATCC 824]AEI32801.1 hypothetical protein SMB_G3404 [Clostridium acetobutylicum DSM 1731]AWV82237.1 molecular chaperone Hsp60 [Clostridium acetobutylicum]MBC2395549.1 molecular chaperone Hsp60 [Clostridium acetobutylicum]MBC2584237.1 molecular chaperone Hsp60 [Clostridium acetobutylicum]
MEVRIMDSMISKFKQMGDMSTTAINRLRQAQNGVKNVYVGASSIEIQRNIDDVLKSGKEVTETLYKLSIQLSKAKDAIIKADKDSGNGIKLNTIIRGEEKFSKVTDSKETISNMKKAVGYASKVGSGIGYFELGAAVSVANNLALGLPGLLGVYNDKRLIYKLENENRYGVLAAYQYGKMAGDLEGEVQGTLELFGGLSIMGVGGFGAGALTLATDGAAAPAVPAVESVGVAVAAHGVGMIGSSLSHFGSDFAKGSFYLSKMEKGYNNPSEITPKAIKDIKKKWGQKGIEAFEKAKNKGIVGAEGQNGIKKLKGPGMKKGDKIYTYEIKVKNKEYGDYRILGYKNSNGEIIFDYFRKGMH